MQPQRLKSVQGELDSHSSEELASLEEVHELCRIDPRTYYEIVSNRSGRSEQQHDNIHVREVRKDHNIRLGEGAGPDALAGRTDLLLAYMLTRMGGC